jgi:hypothetical protein
VAGKYSKTELYERICRANQLGYLSVFVGSASKKQVVRTHLDEAYDVWNKCPDKTNLGAIVIPERHEAKKNEHLRVIDKQNKGCGFFVSQCVCNVEIVKNFLSDYLYYALDNGLDLTYFVFTLTVCGKKETLDLMNWLGIDIPRWMKNDLVHSVDIIEESIEQNLRIAMDLFDYCKRNKISCGFNIESVSPNKAEVEGTVTLFNEIRKGLQTLNMRKEV